ncbi:MAG: winged helix-turn-helix domain-containing protein [Janthinobacterium lividum]
MEMLTVAGKQARLVQWQSLVLDLDRCTVRASGVLLGASPAEFALLRLLIARRGVPLAREFIMESLFGSEHGRDVRQADILIARLRRLLTPSGLGNAICTVAGRGYALVADSRIVDSPADSFARVAA